MKQPFNVLRTPQPVYDPITAAIAAAVGATSGTVAYAAIGFAVNLGISAVASYALNALTPKPKLPGSGGFLVNEVNPVAPAEYVYGEVRKGGVVTYDEATDGNAILHRIIVLGAGEYEVGDIYLNDEIVTLSDNGYSMTDPSDPSDVYTGAGWVLTEKWMEDNAVREPRIRIFIHDGSQTATTDTFANSSDRTLANELIAASANGLDANFVGKGLTYLYVQMNIDAEVFAGGIPRITAMVKGKAVYDPRTTSTVWSDNWALCVADYLQASEGLGDTGSVDGTALSVEANTSDEAITLDAGGTQARYALNGVFRADEQPGQILARMMPSGSGNLYWGQGNWNIRAGDYAGSVASFGLSDLRGGISVQTRAPRSENYNAVRGVFNDASQRYIEGEYPQIASATFLAEDGGFENVLEYDLPFETDGIRAQRLAKLALYRQREQIRVEADFSMRAAQVAPGDVIALTVDRYGWTDKEFEVVGWNLKISESGTVCVRLSLKETSEASYDWTAEESVFASNNTNLPDYRATATVTIGTPTVQQISNPGGTEIPLLIVPFTAVNAHLAADYVFQWRENTLDYTANGGFVTLGGSPTAREQLIYDAYLRILYRVPDQDGFDYYVSGAGSGLSESAVKSALAGSTEGQNQAAFQSIITYTTQAELRALQFGKRYDLRVVSRNALGIVGTSSTTTFLVEADTNAPPVPTYTDKTNTVSGKLVTLRWNNPATDGSGNPVYDLRDTEVWRGASATLTLDGNGDPTNADLIGRSASEEYVDTSATYSTTYYYFERARDFAGNLSAFAAGRQVDTTAAAAVTLVSIYADEQLIAYDASGATPAPATVTVTAEATEFTTPYYDFLVDGVSQQNTTSASYTYTPAASDAGMPEVIRVDVREGAGTGSILASDRLTMDAYRIGAGTPIMQLSNEAHDIPADSAGTVTSFAGAVSNANVFIDGVDDTSNWTFAKADSAGVTSTLSVETVTITAMTVDAGYVDITASKAGYTDITKRFSLAKVRGGATGATGPTGSTGATGAAGSQGVPGRPGIIISQTRAQAIVTVDAYGTADLSQTDNTISVTEGTTNYGYDTTPDLSEFEVTAISVVEGTMTIDTSLTNASFNDHTSMSTDKAVVRYTIEGKDSNTDSWGPVYVYQVVTKVYAAERGAGRWHVDVDPSALPTSSATATSAWNTYTSFDPVVGDQAWFYTGTLANPTGQAVFICATVSSGTVHTWTLQNEVIDGNLLVTGTGTFDKLVVNSGIFQDDGSGGLDVITGSMSKAQGAVPSGTNTLTTTGSFVTLFSQTFTTGTQGDMFVKAHVKGYYFDTNGADPTTDYLAGIIRMRVVAPSVSTVTDDINLTLNGTLHSSIHSGYGYTFVARQAELASRTAGTTTVYIDAQISARTPATAYLYMDHPYIEVVEYKR